MNNNIFGHFAGGYMEYLRAHSYPMPQKKYFHINFKDLVTKESLLPNSIIHRSLVVFENPELEKENIGKFIFCPFFGVDESENIIIRRNREINEKNYVSLNPFFCAKMELELINSVEADTLKSKYLTSVLIDYEIPRQFIAAILTDFCPKLITKQNT